MNGILKQTVKMRRGGILFPPSFHQCKSCLWGRGNALTG